MSFEKKSVDPGFAPVNDILKADNVEEKEVQCTRCTERHSSRHSRARAGSHGIRDKFITVFFPDDLPQCTCYVKRHFFLVFLFLKENILLLKLWY